MFLNKLTLDIRSANHFDTTCMWCWQTNVREIIWRMNTGLCFHTWSDKLFSESQILPALL